MSYAIAVDIGGSFTDLAAFDRETQNVIYAKSPTTYDNLVEGVLECLNKAKIKPAEASLLNHGTTLVINSLIERRGAKTALVTSQGFRDILEIARGNRPARLPRVAAESRAARRGEFISAAPADRWTRRAIIATRWSQASAARARR